MLDAIGHSQQGVTEGAEGHELRHVIGRGWIIGIPTMFAASALVLWLATGSLVWVAIVGAWGAVVAGPYFGGFILVNRGELAQDSEASLERLPARGAPDERIRAA